VIGAAVVVAILGGADDVLGATVVLAGVLVDATGGGDVLDAGDAESFDVDEPPQAARALATTTPRRRTDRRRITRTLDGRALRGLCPSKHPVFAAVTCTSRA
jgi:hypothetical protein